MIYVVSIVIIYNVMILDHDIAGLVVNYGISNTIVLEIP